jgi:hypothetical protein
MYIPTVPKNHPASLSRPCLPPREPDPTQTPPPTVGTPTPDVNPHADPLPQPPNPQQSSNPNPPNYTPSSFTVALDVPTTHPIPYYELGYSRTEPTERLLAAGLAWEYIQKTGEYRRGVLDMEIVVKILRGKAVCDGRGPAFRESDVKQAIEHAVALGGGDELL